MIVQVSYSPTFEEIVQKEIGKMTAYMCMMRFYIPPNDSPNIVLTESMERKLNLLSVSTVSTLKASAVMHG